MSALQYGTTPAAAAATTAAALQSFRSRAGRRVADAVMSVESDAIRGDNARLTQLVRSARDIAAVAATAPLDTEIAGQTTEIGGRRSHDLADRLYRFDERTVIERAAKRIGGGLLIYASILPPHRTSQRVGAAAAADVRVPGCREASIPRGRVGRADRRPARAVRSRREQDIVMCTHDGRPVLGCGESRVRTGSSQ